jgi:Transposase IS4
MTARIRLARYSAKEVLQKIFEESDDGEDDITDNDNDSVSDKDDHVSENSEHSDVESADDEVVIATKCVPAQGTNIRSSSSVVKRGRGRGLRGARAGRQQGDAVEPNSSSCHPMTGKNGFLWERQPPASGRRRVQDIIRTSPGVTASSRCGTIFDTYKLFLTPEIIDSIVLQTNREARRRIRAWNERNPENQHAEWKPVNDNEIVAFIGLCILAGVYRANHEPQSSLWSEREGRPVFIATMSRTRFRDIMKYMRFDDKATRDERLNHDKLAALRDLWTMFTVQLPKFFVPGGDLCVDEQLVAYRGKCKFRQYIPSKPAKYGIKIWWCCDAVTSYPLTADIYLGRQEGTERETGQGARVVKQLVSAWRHSGRNVVADNFFSSVDLAEQLLSDQLTYVGTIRSNKPHVPEAMKARRGRQELSSLFGFHDQLTLVSFVPKPGKAVLAISTLHHDATIDAQMKNKPEVILHYNEMKSGVDNMDHLATMYTTRRKINRWPMVLFFNILDITGIASYILWRGNNPDWKISQGRRQRRLFLTELGYDMVTPHMKQRAS